MTCPVYSYADLSPPTSSRTNQLVFESYFRHAYTFHLLHLLQRVQSSKMQAMAAIDRLLGPLNPNKVAQTTAPTTIRVLVFGASDRQGKSVAEFLIRGGKYIVSAIFEDMDHEFQDGMSFWKL
jgi:hypothetical protein